MAFRSLIEQVKRTNVEHLKARARVANALAKITENRAKSTLYFLKSQTTSRLIEMRVAIVGEIRFESDVIIGVWFQGGGGLHVRYKDLSPLAQRVVLEQLKGVFLFHDFHQRIGESK